MFLGFKVHRSLTGFIISGIYAFTFGLLPWLAIPEGSWDREWGRPQFVF